MSGFFGVLRPDGAAIDQQWLAQLAAQLSFRGPDGTNIRAQDGWGSSFAFLQTDPGRQAPQQPVTLDGRFWLIGQVRLDARDALLRRLFGTGPSPLQDGTDEDLLLLAWRQWGEVSLKHLLGDFSFALWDMAENNSGARAILSAPIRSSMRMRRALFTLAIRCKSCGLFQKFPFNSTTSLLEIFSWTACALIPRARCTPTYAGWLRDIS